MTRKQCFRCVVCGKITVGRLPNEGDGTFYYPRRHKKDGFPCPGNVYEAEWIKDNQENGNG